MERDDNSKLQMTQQSPEGDIHTLSAGLAQVTIQGGTETTITDPSVSQSPGPPVTGTVTTPLVHVSAAQQAPSGHTGEEQGGFGEIAQQMQGSLKVTQTGGKVHDPRGVRPKQSTTKKTFQFSKDPKLVELQE